MAAGETPAPLLRQRNFAALCWGQLISILGDRLTYLALGGLLLQHTHRGNRRSSAGIAAMYTFGVGAVVAVAEGNTVAVAVLLVQLSVPVTMTEVSLLRNPV